MDGKERQLREQAVTVGCGDWFATFNKRQARLKNSHIKSNPSKRERALFKQYKAEKVRITKLGVKV